MLNTFLHQALHSAVGLSNLASQFPHLFHICFAQEHKERDDGYSDTSQCRIH